MDFKKLNTKFFKKFLINIALIVTFWLLFYNLFRNIWFIDYIYEEGIFILTNIQIFLSKVILSIAGYSIEVYGKTIKIIGSYGVHVDRGCLGRNTLGLFVGFILAFPGKFSNKLWYIFVGIIIFLFLNILRILGLTITDYCCREYLDFNHHYVFKIVVYVVIFLLWARWIKKYSYFAEKKVQNKENL